NEIADRKPSTDPVRTSHARSTLGHRTSRSISSLPAELQSLSLYAPTPYKDDFELPPNKQPSPPISSSSSSVSSSSQPAPLPSWILPNVPQPVLPTIPTPSRVRGSHARSVSEITLPPPPPAPSATTVTPSPSHPITRTRHTHRRAASANTVDFMLDPTVHSPGRAHSSSPKETVHHHFIDTLPKKQPAVVLTTTQSEESHAGRYVCQYCGKKFTRPSSLRIHTYSHTGEKPFLCTEEGCGRRFNVQSNMRRHLRVHRLGRSVNGNTQHDD
ncbi:hypothetical protein EC973_005999, partial [Apophysomyces ossiformis]